MRIETKTQDNVFVTVSVRSTGIDDDIRCICGMLPQVGTHCANNSVFVCYNPQVCVQFQIIKDKIYDAYYKLTDAKSQITAFVYDVSATSSCS